MFRHDMIDNRKLGTLKTRKEEFEHWRDTQLPKDGKDLSFEGGKEVILGKMRTWLVTSYGDYEDANRNARRFVSYRNGLGTMTRVYSWLWQPSEHRWLRCEDQQFGSW